MAEYKDDRIVDVVDEINEEYFLPHIQRPFVWSNDKIIRLFDSLLRGYPIGTFLFWRIQSGKVRRRKFIENYYTKYTKSFNIEKLGLEDTAARGQLSLVLDGQQRLQSLLIGLNGGYDDKELYFNLLSDQSENNDGIKYEFNLYKRVPKNSDVDLWVKVKELKAKFMNKETLPSDVRESFLEFYKDDKAKEKVIERNLGYFQRAFFLDKRISFYSEGGEDYDRIFDIFVRVNSGGTPLNKSDLLFSFIKLNWSNYEAEKEFPDFLDKINGNDQFKFDVDFVLKTSLMLIGTYVRYSVRTFTGERGLQIARDIESSWIPIKESISTVVDLIKDEFFINNQKLLPSLNAVIPIVHYAYLHKKKSKSDFTQEDKVIIRKWLFNTLLSGVFRGSSDALLESARRSFIFKMKPQNKDLLNQTQFVEEIKKIFADNGITLIANAQLQVKEGGWDIVNGNDQYVIEDANKVLNVYRKILADNSHRLFPAEEINAVFEKMARSTSISKVVLNDICYRSPESYLLLYLIYPYGISFRPSSDRNYPHQDHIFCKDELLGCKYAESDINRIGNIRLVTKDENLHKLNKPYLEWIKTITPEQRKQHLIPVCEDGKEWSTNEFIEFAKAREELMFSKVTGNIEK